jgi:hypothetical protein
MRDLRLIIRLVMAHHHIGRGVEAVDQKAWLVPQRKTDRADHPCHALAAQPVFRGRQQRGKHLVIVNRFDEAEMAACVLITFQMQPVDLGGDAPHRLAAAIGQKELGGRVLKEGIVLGREMQLAFQQQGRHPVGIARINAKRQVVEIAPLLFGANRHDIDGQGGFSP